MILWLMIASHYLYKDSNDHLDGEVGFFLGVAGLIEFIGEMFIISKFI